ncbi:efflux RND transporter permease subunit [Gluconacetobacter takamatsuzukensis]|uniref:MMPL family transporter n=1 Tax=Gluconacetobacter takamatsuzukensis TaxID=1286190 RepID=A0A7W4KC76_9PROT|nr:efflux RND transporter permease subunit [Gluconacetobacter takamatsuzukensis]MBB2204259.1 MMPL family transporter [Gluconacetobacter takamatsuzukensis]
MNPCRPFILRPVTTTLIAIALVLAGLFAYRALPVGDLPNISVPVIYVVATQPGASPQQMATSVTTPLERRLGQISGISSIESDSTDSTAFILLTFDDSRNIDGAANDVQAALRAATQDMPTTLQMVPQYWKANPADNPIMIMALTSDSRPMAELYDVMKTHLQPMLSQIKGVGWIEIAGSSAPAVRVEMNPYPLFKYGIGFEDIRSALASANANTPKGYVDVGPQRYTIATNDQARHAAEYRDLIVGYRSGRPVRLADVASVVDGVEDERQTGYFSGHRAVMAVVRPQPGANVIHVMDEIRARIPSMQAALPSGVTLTPGMDRSITIRASLADTQLTLLISVLLVVGVVLVFLRAPRSTLIPAVTVPISLAGTLSVMYLLGFSLDTLSLMALTIATGFVVDDAIVVVENIARHMEDGMSRREAALLGSGEIAFTVLSITIALVAVFLPLLLMPGTPGKIFFEFAMTLATAVTVSLFLSVTLTPMMCGLLLDVAHGAPLPPGASAARRGLRRLSDGIEAVFEGVLNAYVRSLDRALRHRWLILATLPLSLVATVGIIVVMPKNIIPKEDVALIVGYFRGDESGSFQKMDQKIRAVSAAMMADKDTESVAAFSGDTRVEGQAFAQMVGKHERGDGPDEMIARVRERLKGLAGVRLSLFSAGDVNGGGGRQQQGAYRYVLRSDNAELIYEWTPRIVEALKGSKVMTDITTNLTDHAVATHVDIARDTAARYLVTPQLISQALFDAYGQRSASNISTPLATYHVVMEVAPPYRQSPDIMEAFRVSTSGGTAGGGTASNTVRVPTPDTGGASQATALSQQSFRNAIANRLAGGAGASSGSAVSSSVETMVPLPVVAAIAERPTSISVGHRDGFVSGAISFNLAKGRSLDEATAEIRAAMVRVHVPGSIQGGFTGQAEQFQTALINELLVFLAALATMYVTLGILYESYVHPLTILSTLPSAAVGAVLALWITGEEFSLIAMIGVILLVGIVKKNAILMVDFALHAERDGSMSPEEAIREACAKRFRPILMTTLAAAFGAVPLILSGGYGIELRRPLGIAVVGGLLMSQLLTLYTTPVVYLLLERIRSWVSRQASRRWRGSIRPADMRDRPVA